MSHVYCVNYQHITFHTSRYFIKAEDITEVHSCIARILLRTGVRDIKVGGINNHVHILGNFMQLPVSEVIKQCKTGSNHWLKERNEPYYRHFHWQPGYFQCSVSYADVKWVKNYIANQFRHHLKYSTDDEIRDFLQQNGFKE